MIKFEKFVANWIINDFRGICKKYKVNIENCGISPKQFYIIMLLNYNKHIDKQLVRDTIELLIRRKNGLY